MRTRATERAATLMEREANHSSPQSLGGGDAGPRLALLGFGWAMWRLTLETLSDGLFPNP